MIIHTNMIYWTCIDEEIMIEWQQCCEEYDAIIKSNTENCGNNQPVIHKITHSKQISVDVQYVVMYISK